MTRESLRKRILKFEKSGSLSLNNVLERKTDDMTSLEGEAIALEEWSICSSLSYTALGIIKYLGILVSTVREVLKKVLCYYPYKRTHVQVLHYIILGTNKAIFNQQN